METTTRELTEDEKAATVTEGTFILNLTIGAIRTSAKVKRERVEKMAAALADDQQDPETVAEMASDAADEIRVSKELLRVEEVAAIIAEVSRLRTTIRSNQQRTKSRRGTSLSFLKNGMYLYAATRVEWAEEQVASSAARIASLLDALEPRWPAIIEEDRARLEPLGLFDPRDYPELARIRAAVTPRYGWMQFSVPTKLQSISGAIFAAERAKAKQAWAQMFDEIRLTYRATLAEFVGGLVTALRPAEDGKRRVLRQSTLDRMMDFLTTFRVQDVTGDAACAALADKARAILSGVDAEVLRDERRARERVMESMASLAELIEPLVEDQQRRIVLT